MVFFTYFYPPDSPEGRVLDVITNFKLGYFFHEVLIPKYKNLMMKPKKLKVSRRKKKKMKKQKKDLEKIESNRV